MRIVVIGSGPGGIGAAAPLAAAGHRVTVVERDSEPPGDDDEAWESWERRSVPQMRHPHFFLARLWREMSDMAPDLRAELEACDPYVLRFADRVPPTTPDADALRADRELVAMGFRRPTFERAMWSWLRRQANIDVRSGAAVRALVSESGSGVPRVRGVVLEDDTVIDADIVVAATGRHGAAVRWLHETGAGPVEEEEADAGLAYFSRVYRRAPARPHRRPAAQDRRRRPPRRPRVLAHGRRRVLHQPGPGARHLDGVDGRSPAGRVDRRARRGPGEGRAGLRRGVRARPAPV